MSDKIISAEALRDALFSYFDCVNKDTNKQGYKGDMLMSYEVADMIEDCVDNAPEISDLISKKAVIEIIESQCKSKKALESDENQAVLIDATDLLNKVMALNTQNIDNQQKEGEH